MSKARWLLLSALTVALGADSLVWQPSAAAAQEQLNVSGYVNVPGRKVPYLIRHLPLNSFPDLPPAIQAELSRRGCLIPQTYEAHQPENVVHGSFEKAGSSDWAVLCSANGNVSLLVFFASAPEKPFVLTTVAATERLQPHHLTGVMGFNWGIDEETPAQVRGAQFGMEPRPPKLDHDALGDSVIEHKTVYRYYTKGGWTVVETME